MTMTSECTCLDCENFRENPNIPTTGICVILELKKINGEYREIIAEVEFTDDEFTVDEMGCEQFTPTFETLRRFPHEELD